MRSSTSIPVAASLCRRAAASLALLTADLVIEHPSCTCSAQMQIHIPSRVQLGTQAAPPDHEYRAHAVSFNLTLASGTSVGFSHLFAVLVLISPLRSACTYRGEGLELHISARVIPIHIFRSTHTFLQRFHYFRIRTVATVPIHLDSPVEIDECDDPSGIDHQVFSLYIVMMYPVPVQQFQDVDYFPSAESFIGRFK
jgi:hypothetical protein